ncbi:MAG: hypothetical protein JXQ85_04600 [Cognatishimia sp.]|uniref:hypothetical protein n=1 Tax=Cognatishimia sp. TaxID=2211648 RepID=UPI003B8C7578
MLTEAGADVAFCQREAIHSGAEFGSDAFHFVHQGLVRQKNALNTGLSYFPKFWYVDPRGVFGESSIATKTFDPRAINEKWASGFARRMREQWIDTRRSKHSQPNEKKVIGQGYIAVFLQGESKPVRRSLYMEETEMVEALLAGLPDRRILVKAHPRNDDIVTRSHLLRLEQDHSRLELVDANVHDLLAGACLSCSISSSVSVEGMLHNVPSMLFGRTDFHHCAVTVQNASDVPYAFDMAMKTEWPFEKFLFWFFRQNCVDERNEDWIEPILKILAERH